MLDLIQPFEMESRIRQINKFDLLLKGGYGVSYWGCITSHEEICH